MVHFWFSYHIYSKGLIIVQFSFHCQYSYYNRLYKIKNAIIFSGNFFSFVLYFCYKKWTMCFSQSLFQIMNGDGTKSHKLVLSSYSIPLNRGKGLIKIVTFCILNLIVRNQPVSCTSNNILYTLRCDEIRRHSNSPTIFSKDDTRLSFICEPCFHKFLQYIFLFMG